MRVLFLGAGSVGSDAARQMGASRPDVQIRVGDLRLENAQRAAARAGANAEAVQVDVHDAVSLAASLADVDIVLNTAGPFYRNAVPIVEGAIAAGVDYVDINDDDDVALRLLGDADLRARAEAAGVRIIIGCGTSPGLSNVIARHSMDQLDSTQSVIVTMLLSLQAAKWYSPAVLDHMFHITSGDVSRYEGGSFKTVEGFGDEREIRGLAPFGTYKSYNAGHGETVMLGHSHPDLDLVSVRLGWVEEDGNAHWRTLKDLGLSSGEVIESAGISPVQFLGALVGSGRELPFFEAETPGRNGTVVEVTGTRAGREVTIKTLINYGSEEDFDPETFSLDDIQDPTSTAARIAVEAVLDGRVSGGGLLTPEVCFDPTEFIQRFAQDSIVKLTQETTVSGEFPVS